MDELGGFIGGIFFFFVAAYFIALAVFYLVAVSLILAPAGITSWYLYKEMGKDFSSKYQRTFISSSVLIIIGLLTIVVTTITMQHADGWQMALASLYGVPAGLLCAYLTIIFWGWLNSKEQRKVLNVVTKEYNKSHGLVNSKKSELVKTERKLNNLQGKYEQEVKRINQCIALSEKICRFGNDPRGLILYKEKFEKELKNKTNSVLEKEFVVRRHSVNGEIEELQCCLLEIALINRQTSDAQQSIKTLSDSLQILKQEYQSLENGSKKLQKKIREGASILKDTRIVLN